MINLKQFLKLKEDVVGGTAAPANTTGTGGIAGTGGEGGEPGVYRNKKKKSPILAKIIKRTPKQ